MQRGFPLPLLRLVRCSVDGGELRCISGAVDDVVVTGTARCERCGRTHRIADGVLSLLDAGDVLHEESALEMRVRDQRNEAILTGTRREWATRVADATEVAPTLAALGLQPGMTVAELGCGPGRYTLAIAGQAAAVLAIDFSRAGLLVLRQKLPPETMNVAIVHADVTRPYAAPGSCDRVLSTLHSNLPDRDHRAAALAQAAAALADTGVAVISMHHYSALDFVRRTPAIGRYRDSGVFREYFRRAAARDELQQLFGAVAFTFIAATIPGIRSIAAARLAAATPVVRGALAKLFLAVGSMPRRTAGTMFATGQRT